MEPGTIEDAVAVAPAAIVSPVACGRRQSKRSENHRHAARIDNERQQMAVTVVVDTYVRIKKRRSRIPGGTGITFDRRSAARRRGDTFRGATVLSASYCEGRANPKPKVFDGFSPDIASFHCRLAIARLQLRKRLEHCECARRVVGWSPNTSTTSHVAFHVASPPVLSEVSTPRRATCVHHQQKNGEFWGSISDTTDSFRKCNAALQL
jgi:hypothetical protein